MATCPSRDQLSGYVRGTLPEPAVAAIADHVEHCPPCESTVVALEGETSRMVQALRRPAADSFAAEPQLAAALARAVSRRREGEAPAEPMGVKAGESQKARQEPRPPHSREAPSAEPSISAAPGGVSLEAMIARMNEAGIVPTAESHAFLAGFPAARRPADGKALAAELVAAGRLTKFQANLLYFDRAKELIYGEYLIADKIGAGGMGQVFRAEHRLMKRPVAIKLIRAKALGKDEAVKRFQREVQAAAKLNHPNIVTAHDAGEKAGVHFLVMELVAGDDLGALVKKRGALPVEEAVGLVVQAGRGLAYAHGKGVVHRDIKPSNLLLDSDGTVKVLDLGLARMANVGTEEGLTQTGQVMGTVDYMAPEQAIDTRSADARSDIYSLGCTLYRLLTNQNVFAGESLGAKLLAHAQQAPPSLRAARPDAPEALDRALQKMLAKQPEHRYQTMAECLAALEAAIKPGARPLPVAKALPGSGEESTQSVAPLFSFAPAAPPLPPPLPGKPTAQAAPPVLRTAPEGNGASGGMNPLLLWGSLGGAAAILILGVVIIIRHNDGSETKIEGDGKIAVQVTPGKTPSKPPLAGVPKPPADPGPAPPVEAAPPRVVAGPTGDRRAAEWFLGLGDTTIEIVVDGRVQLVRSLDELPPGDIRLVSCEGTSAFTKSGKGIECLAGLKHIEILNFSDWYEDDAEHRCRQLAGLTSLRRLVLISANVNDACLAHLKGLKNLELLVLSDSSVTDDGLVHLAALDQVETLAIEATRISAKGLRHLRGMTRLKTLVWRSPNVTGDAIAELAAFPNLEELWIGGPSLGNKGLENFKNLAALRTLTLYEAPQITDQGIAPLATALQVKFLHGSGTGITNAGWAQLLNRMPQTAFGQGILEYKPSVRPQQYVYLAQSASAPRDAAATAEARPAAPGTAEEPAFAWPLPGQAIDPGNAAARAVCERLVNLGVVLRIRRFIPSSDSDVKWPDRIPEEGFHLVGALFEKAHPVEDYRALEAFGNLSLLEFTEGLPPDGLGYVQRFAGLAHLGLRKIALRPEQLRTLAGSRKLQTLVLDTNRLAPGDWTFLRDLPRLWSLTIDTQRLDANSLRELAACKNLTHLEIARVNLADEDLSELAALEKLKTLRLIALPIRGAGLRHLAALEQLQSLDLTGCKVEDQALEHLAKVRTLEKLVLSQAAFMKPNFAALAQWTKLKELHLLGCGVTDVQAVQVARIETLTLLAIADAPGLTERGLEAFHVLARLRHIALERTGISKPAFDQFMSDHPNLSASSDLIFFPAEPPADP